MMRLSLKPKAENSFLNPNAIQERALVLSFEGTNYTRPLEVDVGAVAVNLTKLSVPIFAVSQYAQGNTLLATMLGLVTLGMAVGRSEVLSNTDNSISPRYDDVSEEAQKTRIRHANALSATRQGNNQGTFDFYGHQ